MLVINERAAMPRSEQRVLDWMRTWKGQYIIVGLAISGCHVPRRHRKGGDTQEADLVLITPRAVVVIEVKGTVPDATSGVLSVQANGRWRLSGFDGDPIHVRDQDTSPFDQVTDNVFNLKELVRKHHSDAYVDGLIVVVPPWESTVTLEVESRRHGCGVVLGSTPGELRAWLHRTSNRKLLWTAEAVHALLTDLNLDDLLTIEDLLAEGFPSETGRRPKPASPVEAKPAPETPARESAFPDHLSKPLYERAAAAGAPTGIAAESAFPESVSEPAEAPGEVRTSTGGDALPSEARGTAPDDSRREMDSPSPDPDSDAISSARQGSRVAAEGGGAESDAAAPEFTRPEEAAEYRGVRLDRVPGHKIRISEYPIEEGAPSHVPVVSDEARGPSDADMSDDAVRRVLNYTAPAIEPADIGAEPHRTTVLHGASAGSTPARDGVSAAPHPRDDAHDGHPEYPGPHGDLSPAQRRHVPDSGGQRPHHSAPHRTDYDPPWIAPDDNDPPRIATPDYVRPPWIAPDEEAVRPIRPAHDPSAVREVDFRGDYDPRSEYPADPESSGEFRDDNDYDDHDPDEVLPPASASPSSYTDRWSSWIEPRYGAPAAPLRRQVPLRTVAPPAPQQTAPGLLDPPRPRHQDWMTAVRDRIPTRLIPKVKADGDLPQQMGAVIVIAAAIGAIWILASACTATYRDAVQQQQPSGTSEVEPQGVEKAKRAPIATLPLCFPRPTDC
ncbi:nuclease-related domain-containing protein [Nocardia arizonensis]|uniref:nuclease-related domain-containing protein n=1 Tax=Nocardia arizonensis TaxID=1141647 RepID=UPI0006D2B0DF|nr:nuclease-related domain-containing protein [Nocardia arizonensis]